MLGGVAAARARGRSGDDKLAKAADAYRRAIGVIDPDDPYILADEMRLETLEQARPLGARHVADPCDGRRSAGQLGRNLRENVRPVLPRKELRLPAGFARRV